MHGQFVWYELTTPDVDAARKFYPAIAGWGTQPFDQDYTMWTIGGTPFAGLFRLRPEQRSQGIPPNWMAYVETDDVDRTAKLATSLGGTVVHVPADIPGTGRFAVLQDPQGAMFGIYKANGPSQSWDGTPELGRFSWHELMTTDWAKAFDFYRQLFGWEMMDQMDMGGGNMYVIYGKGKMFGGMFTRTPDMAGMHPFWLCYILVKDVHKAVATAIKGGGMLQRGPMEIPGGEIAILGDPQGAGFAVHHATPALAAPRTTAKAAPKKTAKKAPKNAVKKAVKKAAKRAAKPAPKKTARKASRKASKRVPQRIAKSVKKRPNARAAAKKRSASKKTGRKRTTASKRSRR